MTYIPKNIIYIPRNVYCIDKGNKMKRRSFIRILGVGTGSMLLFSALPSCSNQEYRSQLGWRDSDLSQSDICLKLLSYAMLSPNPHNIQPWLVQFTGRLSFKLYVDTDRLLPETDPYFRQIHIGHGTFLETLAIAASGFGYLAEIDYFPDGNYGNTVISTKAVASIVLKQNAKLEIEPLFSEILKRHSNKREYNNTPLSAAQVEQLSSFHSASSNSHFKIEQSAKIKAELEKLLTEAMAIEVADRKRDLETIKMFRFDDKELKQHRDGFGLSQSGVSGVQKFIAENFILSRDDVEKDSTEFGQQAVEIVKKQAASTACFGWLCSDSNERLDQVLIGREYCRLNLKTSAMGLVQHPMSQILQEYKQMLPLQSSLKNKLNLAENKTVQMLFRIGIAEPTAHSPRRVVRDIIVNSQGK